MKTVNSILFISIAILLMVNSECKPERPWHNTAPISNAGPDQVITLPTDNISLDGSASSDPDGTISSYLWKKIEGPASFNITAASSAKTAVKNLVAGAYQFELKVTDDKGLFAKDTVQISVIDPRQPNRPPVANASADQAITLPTNSVNLNGNGSSDPDNNIVSYLWTKITGPSSFLIEHPDSLSTKVSNLQIGVYQFELTVTDGMGMYGKDTIKVTVNTAPTIAPKANAGPDKLVYYPTNFTNLSGSMSTWGNIIQTISWSKISGPSSFLIETPNSLGTKVSNLQIGVYQFEMFVQDNAGLTDKDTCTVIVGQLSATPNEVIFTNQVWFLEGWGSAIVISNVYQYLPAGSVFRAYIKRDNFTNWEELTMDDYNSWFTVYLLDGDLHIFSYYDGESDTPDIKLVY